MRPEYTPLTDPAQDGDHLVKLMMGFVVLQEKFEQYFSRCKIIL